MNKRFLASGVAMCVTCLGIGALMMFALLEQASKHGGWTAADGFVYEIVRTQCDELRPRCPLWAQTYEKQ